MQQDTETDLDQFHDDSVWFEEHYNELVAKYPGQWVAIHHEKLVAASHNLRDLIANMKASQQPFDDIYFKFVPGKQLSSGLSDLYGIWEDMDITEEDIEASRLKFKTVQY